MMSEQEICKGLLSLVNESIRLNSLTNAELVREALTAGLCDISIVDEMMTRLDPLWYWRDTETDPNLPPANIDATAAPPSAEAKSND